MDFNAALCITISGAAQRLSSRAHCKVLTFERHRYAGFGGEEVRFSHFWIDISEAPCSFRVDREPETIRKA
jgi:hypothetical protein